MTDRARGDRALFEPAPDDVVAAYDDICVICHDGFSPTRERRPGGERRIRKDTAIRLPRARPASAASLAYPSTIRRAPPQAATTCCTAAVWRFACSTRTRPSNR